MRKLSNKTVPLLIFLFFFIISSINCKSRIPSNFQIIDSLISIASDNICNDLISGGINKTIIVFPKHSATWLIKQEMLKSAEKFNLSLFTESQNIELTKLDININDCKIQYKNMDNPNDSLIRICNVNISGIIHKPLSSIKSLKTKQYYYRDTISREDLININDTNYDFLNPKIPDKKRSFFEKITEPIIVVTSAILVVILFFTVRSG